MYQTCFDCRFWIASGLEPHEAPNEQRHWDYGDREGRCVRHPPRVQPIRIDKDGDEYEPLARWPTTFSGDWCGEFARRIIEPVEPVDAEVARSCSDPRRS